MNCYANLSGSSLLPSDCKDRSNEGCLAYVTRPVLVICCKSVAFQLYKVNGDAFIYATVTHTGLLLACLSVHVLSVVRLSNCAIMMNALFVSIVC